MAGVNVETRENRWRKAIIGPLPPDFLRISTPREIQEAADCQAAMALYQQQAMPQYVIFVFDFRHLYAPPLFPRMSTIPIPSTRIHLAPNHVGRLSITCAQARLVRNYGITRMDPYVRIRVGHYVYETQTDPNGGKNPRWNRVIQSQLPVGVNTISIEIYDECSFKMDELIAWADIKIPDIVLRGETHEEWYPLSGKQGDGLEGTIDIVLSFGNQPVTPYMYPISAAPMVMVPPGRPMPIFVAPQQAPPTPPPPPHISEADLKQVHEMFPNIDKEVVKSVFEANRGNKDAAVNCLLQVNE